MAKFKVTAPKSIHDSLEPMRTHFPKGSVMFSEGDLGLAMYVIEGGEVEVRKQLGGEERVLATLGKGDFFGEMCMLEEDSPRSATVVAIDDVDAVMISAPDHWQVPMAIARSPSRPSSSGPSPTSGAPTPPTTATRTPTGSATPSTTSATPTSSTPSSTPAAPASRCRSRRRRPISSLTRSPAA